MGNVALNPACINKNITILKQIFMLPELMLAVKKDVRRKSIYFVLSKQMLLVII
jgi:hypothetical protein